MPNKLCRKAETITWYWQNYLVFYRTNPAIFGVNIWSITMEENPDLAQRVGRFWKPLWLTRYVWVMGDWTQENYCSRYKIHASIYHKKIFHFLALFNFIYLVRMICWSVHEKQTARPFIRLSSKHGHASPADSLLMKKRQKHKHFYDP